MKRIFLLPAFFIFMISGIFAKEIELPKDTFDYNTIVLNLKGPSAPFVDGDYLIFTVNKGPRSVGITFDFENFRTVHQMDFHNLYDDEGKVKDSWFFYLLEYPKNLKSISYRLVIDGLWTSDPLNDEKYYDSQLEVMLSKVDLDTEEPKITEVKMDSGLTHFVCKAESGKKIRLGGSFTNWDSWIYELSEVEPGRYEIDLPLPKGKYYYSYYIGMNSFTDDTNPIKGYTADGRTASYIEVN